MDITEVETALANHDRDTLNRWLFEGNQIAFKALKSLSPRTISEGGIFGLVFGPYATVHLFDIVDWQQFLTSFLKTDYSVTTNINLHSRFQENSLSILIAISFVTVRGREWLAYQNITFEQGASDNEIGECRIQGKSVSRNTKKVLIYDGLEHNILYNVTQDIDVLIEVYDSIQNSKLVQENWNIIVRAFVRYCNVHYLQNTALLKEIIIYLSPKQLFTISINSCNNCRDIIYSYIDWSCCNTSQFSIVHRLQNSMYKLPHVYLQPDLTEAKLYKFLQDGYPSVRLPQNFRNTESYFRIVKSSPRIRAMLSLTDVGTFTTKEYFYLPEKTQQQIFTICKLRRLSDNIVSALPFELLFLIFFYM